MSFLKSFSGRAFRLPAIAVAVLAAGVSAEAAEAPRTVLAPARLMESVADIKWTPAPGCVLGQDCVVAIGAESRITSPDRRRLAVVLDWPANLYVPTRPDGAWHCRPFSPEQLVCLARVDELAPGQVSHLTLRLPATGDPKLCAAPLKPYDTSEDGQARAIRLLQALAADLRREPRMPDGLMTAETRGLLAGLAKDFGVPGDLEGGLVAALTGSAFNRQPVLMSPCVGLITPAARNGEGQGAAIAPARPKAASKDAAKDPAKPLDAFATRAGQPADPQAPPGLIPPLGGQGAPPPFESRPPPPGTIVRGDPDGGAGILLRPWRIRPLQGLRRILGD